MKTNRSATVLLDVDKINVFHGDLQALWDVSFRVNQNETVVILGSNGAGKTTILKTVSGLLHPKSGTIGFMNKEIQDVAAHEIVDLGLVNVLEGRHVFPTMSVIENLQLGAYTRRARKSYKDNLEWVCKLFPILKEREKQLAGTLSGGEQQILAIARALMSKAKLLMLDEPSLGLSPKMMMMVFDIIEKLREENVTILLVEQNVSRSLELADRAYVLETGRIVLEGSGGELMKNQRVREAYLGA